MYVLDPASQKSRPNKYRSIQTATAFALLFFVAVVMILPIVG